MNRKEKEAAADKAEMISTALMRASVAMTRVAKNLRHNSASNIQWANEAMETATNELAQATEGIKTIVGPAVIAGWTE